MANDKKEYVMGYVKKLDTALKGLFDESREEEILAADQEALGNDYDTFEKTITEAYSQVEAARNILKQFADTL